MKTISKEEAIMRMVQDPEEDESVYTLTDHIGIHIVSIINRKDKWFINIWNDYHDFTVSEIEIKEADAINYINYTTLNNETIKECIELLGQDGIDSKQIVANKLKELL